MRASGDVNVLESFAKDEPVSGRGWAVITASDSMEYAFEGNQLADDSSAPQPSVFTHAVVEGLETGEADLDADGKVSLDDLYESVYRQVREQNPHQTPKKAAELHGELHLAHSRLGRIKIVAVPSPPSLRTALNSEEFLTRQGAVLELEKRLQHTELPVAEGARRHLEEGVARNDIQQIAVMASDALGKIRLAPYPDHLDFGRVPKGSAPHQQSVTMHGPPLARHCVAQPRQSWLRVDPTGSGLDVHIDTATEGRLSGDIVLKGVADESVIHVEAEVAPAHGPGHIEPEPGPVNDSATPPQGTDGKRETVVIDPRRIPSRPEKPPVTTAPARRTDRRAPALAGAALALAVAAIDTLTLAMQRAVVAVVERGEEGVHGSIEDNVREYGALTPLTVCLITGAVALVVGAVARRDLGTRQEHYTRQAASSTHTLTSIAKGLAIPALVLAVLAGIAYLVGSPHW
ncbi:hypothetical protein ACFY64_34395 [Streptomyces collinus]|uniref:hypothetical protein n=1 Tax=Streptomyces collinus TaxID=42684 RepID=UPI00368738CD